MPDGTCSVPSCVRGGQLRRGMCEMHYRRATRDGYPAMDAPARITGDLTARFWSYVDQDGPIPEIVEWLGPCWSWTGHTDDKGYGHLQVEGRSLRTHRVAYELLIGPVPDDLELDHLCRNTGCVRPEHLEPVTTAENVRRRNYAKAGKPWLSQPDLSASKPN